MKTTRVFGFVAGLVAVVAMVAIGFGVIAGLTKLGVYALMAGMGAMMVALVLGIVHFLLRIKFKSPYQRRRGPQGFLRAGRIMVWVWGFAMIATGAMLAYLAIQLGPGIFAMLMG